MKCPLSPTFISASSPWGGATIREGRGEGPSPSGKV